MGADTITVKKTMGRPVSSSPDAIRAREKKVERIRDNLCDIVSDAIEVLGAVFRDPVSVHKSQVYAAVQILRVAPKIEPDEEKSRESITVNLAIPRPLQQIIAQAPQALDGLKLDTPPNALPIPKNPPTDDQEKP